MMEARSEDEEGEPEAPPHDLDDVRMHLQRKEG